MDSMAEGLEEESKRALQMESDLEKHHAAFEVERQQLQAAIAKEEKRWDLQKKTRASYFDFLRVCLNFRAREAETQLEAFKRRFAENTTMGRPQSASTYVTKVVPTATVSSKPVSAPSE